jgi:hypothetical protein
MSIAAATRLRGRAFLCSTSGWTGLHLGALRVLQFRDFPIQRLCPSQYIVSDTSELARKVREIFSLSTRDVQARRYNPMSFESKFYNDLATLLRITRQTPSPRSFRSAIAAVLRPTVANYNYISPSNRGQDNILSMSFFSDSTDSSFPPPKSPFQSPPDEQQGPREVVTNSMVIAFLDNLSTLAYPDFNPVRQRPEFNACPDSIKIVVNGASLASENDGSAWKMRWSSTGNQWVTTGGVPLVTVEAGSGFL